MRSTHRALAMLALGLALVGSTTAAAFAAPAPPVTTSDELAQRKALYQSELALNLQRRGERQVLATAAAPINISDELAQRKALYQSELGANLQRNARPDHPVVFAPIVAQPAATGSGVNVLATVLLGLAAGLVGGAALIAGWTAATRRRPHRTAAAT
jgi:hypothetical protein